MDLTFKGRPVLIGFVLLALHPAAALAQADPPEREESIIVYGDDPCPQSSDPEEIVVCARKPEEERFRIPEPLRRSSRPPETSWGTQAAMLEDAQRDTRPNSCSVVGSYGQSGCTQQMLREWAAERRARPSRGY